MEVLLMVLGFIIVCILTLIVAVSFLSIIDRIRYKLPSPKELAKIQQELKERLLNPEFKEIETHFGHSFPSDLKALYKDKTEILRMDFSVAQNEGMKGKDRFYVCSFDPADMQNVGNTYLACEKYFCFANDGCGNSYMIDPKLVDPPVKFHDLEEGKIETICPSLSEFLSWPKFDEFAKE